MKRITSALKALGSKLILAGKTLFIKVLGPFEVYIKILILLMVCMSFINWNWNPATWNVLCRTIVVVGTLLISLAIQVLAYVMEAKQKANGRQ